MEAKKRMHVTDERLMLMNCKWMNDGQWKRNQCYIGVNVRLWWLCLAPLRHRSGAGATLAPLQLLGPPEGPCVSVCYCSHCTHRLLHLHVAHGGVRGGFRPVRQLLVAASLGIQQVGQWAQLEVVSICNKTRKKESRMQKSAQTNRDKCNTFLLCHFCPTTVPRIWRLWVM